MCMNGIMCVDIKQYCTSYCVPNVQTLIPPTLHFIHKRLKSVNMSKLARLVAKTVLRCSRVDWEIGFANVKCHSCIKAAINF